MSKTLCALMLTVSTTFCFAHDAPAVAELMNLNELLTAFSWDEEKGDNTGFINRSYMSLTHKIVDR